MRHSRIIPFLVVVAIGLLGATTRRHDDAATRLANELRDYLRDARVNSVEFRLGREAEPRLRLKEQKDVAAIVRSFVDALAADDLHEGKQFHQPSQNVLIRFVVEDGPDVRLNYVGVDMFWAAKTDEEPEWKPKWVNLQTAALTKCFRKQIDQVSPTTRSSPSRK